MNNKTFTPKYDNDLIPKWYFEQTIDKEIFMVGEIRTIMGSIIPEGWLLCNGDEISRTRYKKLYNVIGTLYGTGDGVSTFNLPEYEDEISVLGYKIIKY